MSTARFPRDARVRARSDFDRIFKHGRRVALPVLALHWLRPGMPVDPSADAAAVEASGAPRLGLAVSRKVDRRAVGRNRVKRVLRDTFRRHRHLLADGDYVLVARPPAAVADTGQLQHALLSLLRRAGALAPDALPATAPTGTMPTPDVPAASLPSRPAPPPSGA